MNFLLLDLHSLSNLTEHNLTPKELNKQTKSQHFLSCIVKSHRSDPHKTPIFARMRDAGTECSWKVRTWEFIGLRYAVEIFRNQKSPSSEIGVTYINIQQRNSAGFGPIRRRNGEPKSPKLRPEISESESDERGRGFFYFSVWFFFFFNSLSVFVGNVGKCGTGTEKDLLFVILCILKWGAHIFT